MKIYQNNSDLMPRKNPVSALVILDAFAAFPSDMFANERVDQLPEVRQDFDEPG